MNTIPDHSGTIGTWRPTPWIAAVLGLVFGGVGLLYVQRAWLAVAFYCLSWAAALALLYAVWGLGFYIDLAVLGWFSWAIAIACAVYAYRVACATASVAERKWYSRWYVLVAVVLVPLVAVFLVRSFVYESYKMQSQSMHPTIPERSWLFVTKPGFGLCRAYGITIWRSPPTAQLARGEIVAHRLVTDPGTTFIGRIAGLPGERIEYRDRRLVIDGKNVPVRLEARDGMYQYAVERLDGHEATVAFIPERRSRDWTGVVPPDHYFVLGDSRDNARDSRFDEVGFVPRDHIVGRIVKIVKEPNRR